MVSGWGAGLGGGGVVVVGWRGEEAVGVVAAGGEVAADAHAAEGDGAHAAADQAGLAVAAGGGLLGGVVRGQDAEEERAARR